MTAHGALDWQNLPPTPVMSGEDPYARPRLQSGEYLAPTAAMHHASVDMTMTDFTAILELLPYPAAITNEVAQPLYRNTAAVGRIETRNDVLTLAGPGQKAHPDVQISRLGTGGLATHYVVIWKVATDLVGTRLSECRQRWGLTRRQYQVLGLLVRGKDNRAIGDSIGCSGRTVELHVSGLLEKSECQTRAQLIAHFWEGVGG